MNIVYALEDLSQIKFPTLALIGPTPRTPDVKSWRPSFIKALQNFNFKGTVLVPETSDGSWKQNYDTQIEWEHEMLEKADLLLFWMPREMKTMPGLVSNIEWGMYIKSGKILYGRPVESVKNSYLDYTYKKFCNKTPYNNIYDLAKNAIKFLDERVTPCQTATEALKAVFLREENLTLSQVKTALFVETSFAEDQILQGLSDLHTRQFIRYNFVSGNFYLNKEKIIQDIIE